MDTAKSFYGLLGHKILVMSFSSIFDLSEAVHRSWNKQRRLCYLILGLIVVVVLIAHFVVWTVHYGTYVSTPCYRNATGGPHLVYDEPLTTGSYAHIILCLWAIVISIFDTLEYIQITWGYVGRKYISNVILAHGKHGKVVLGSVA